MYGPVRTVVWQGSAGDRRPYADQVGLWEVSGPLNLELVLGGPYRADKSLANWCSNRMLFPDVVGSWRSWIIAAAFKFPLSNLKSTTLH